MSRGRPHNSRRLETALAFLAPLLPAYLAATQGFNLLDDGLWLLGAKTLMQGGVLYRDLFIIYGPAKFVLLTPFFLIMGASALALAALKATTLATASGLGFAAVRRRGPAWIAWLMPLGALALWATKPRYVAAGALALATAKCLETERRPRTWFLLGLGWAATACFGFDAAVYGVVIVVGSLVLARRRRPDRTRLLALAAGAGAGIVLLVGVGVITGSLDDAIWDTVVYPLTRFDDEMGLSPVDSFLDGDVVGALFVDHQTGETYTEAWPGHRVMAATARRLLYLSLLILPPLGAWIAWRRGDRPQLAAVSAFALAGWMTAGVRGEVVHLASGWLGTLWLAPLLVASVEGARRTSARIGLGVFAALALLPLAIEPLWLATHLDRPQLATWERDTAGIRLTRERIDGLEALAPQLERDVSGAAVFWPGRPGLNFFFDIPAASFQATLLGGEIRDPQRILASLRDDPRHSVLFHPPLRRDRRSHKDVAPEIWAGLRDRYRVTARLSGGPDEFTVLTPLPDAVDIADVPLQARLHDERASIADAVSPPLGASSFVGQSLPVGPSPLSGMAVRFVSDRATRMPLAIRVRELVDGRPGAVLGRYRIDVDLAEGQNLRFLPFGPVSGSGSRDVIVAFGLAEDVAAEIRMLWHEKGDAYSGGTAWIDGRPRTETLYFQSY